MGSGKTRAPSGVTRYDARLLDRAFDPSLAQVFSDERRQVNLYCAQVILDQDAAIRNELGKDAKAWEYGAHYWEGEAKRLDRERSDLEVKLARVTEERDAGRCACVVSPDMEEPVSSCDYHEKQAADVARVTAERDEAWEFNRKHLVTLDCPCCGDIGAVATFFEDGAETLCGCGGCVTADGTADISVDECVNPACREEVSA